MIPTISVSTYIEAFSSISVINDRFEDDIVDNLSAGLVCSSTSLLQNKMINTIQIGKIFMTNRSHWQWIDQTIVSLLISNYSNLYYIEDTINYEESSWTICSTLMISCNQNWVLSSVNSSVTINNLLTNDFIELFYFTIEQCVETNKEWSITFDVNHSNHDSIQ